MDNTQETFSALEQLKNQLWSIHAREVSDTKRMLQNMATAVDNIEKKELCETASRLRNLATDLGNIGKKEHGFMKIFGIEDDELVHSRFLAWLLDPSETHGLGAYFVEKFLCKATSKARNFDISNLDFSNLSVKREEISDTSRSDIRLFDQSGSFHCTIENKIRSREGDDQTNRLYGGFHGMAPIELFIFLSLGEKEKPKNPNFISLTYREVLPLLKELLKVSSDNDTRFLIENYVNTLERLIMSEKFEGYSEKTKLYYEYWKYIDEVKNAFEQDRKALLSTLEEEIKRRKWWDDKSWEMEKTGGEIYVWKTPWYLNEKEGVYFELQPSNRERAISLYVYGEPSGFSTGFSKIFKDFLEKKHPGKLASDFRKTFSTAVSKFLEKEIQFSPAEKDQVEKILKSLDEMVVHFEEIIDMSIDAFKKKRVRQTES